MIVYNVTTKVDHAIANDWLIWLQEIHIPEIISTGCFSHAPIFQLLETDEAGGLTYTVQYHTESMSLYNTYIHEHSRVMRQKALDKWGSDCTAFHSIMQVVH